MTLLSHLDCRRALKSAKGVHYADILERLTAKKQDRPAAETVSGAAGSGERPTEAAAAETGEKRTPPAAARSDENCTPAPRPESSTRPDPPSPERDRPATSRDPKPRVATNGRGSGNGARDASRLQTDSGDGSEPQPSVPDAARAVSLGPDPGMPANTPEDRHRPSRIAAGIAVDKSQLIIATTRRVRNKAHLLFVASRPCLICEGLPCHAHHITFAQSRGLSLKVSDEFTVPLCAVHHNALHATSNERVFWRQHGIDPLAAARELWLGTLDGQSHVPDQG